MNLIDVIILSFVEGITEFLPVSSTAHLYITEKILHISLTPFVLSFTIIIQVGALLGTVLYMYKNLEKFEIDYKKIISACIPTLLIGFVLYKVFKHILSGNIYIIGYSLIIGSFVMIGADIFLKKIPLPSRKISLPQSVVLGIAQATAIIPGVSRSGAVLVVGYFLKIEKETITKFSFLIGVPVAYMAALYDIYKEKIIFSPNELFYTIFGIFLSGIIAYFVAEWFLLYIRKINITHFAIYRIVMGIIVLLFLV